LQRNYNLLREAAKTSEVHVLAFDQPASRPANVAPRECVHALRSFCASADWVPLAQGTRRYHIALRGLPSNDPFEFHWLNSRAMRDKLQILLRRLHFDIVHFDTLGLAQFRYLVRNSGTVLNHHDVQSSLVARRATLEPHFLRRQYWNLEAKKLRRAEKNWCCRFDVNLAVSKEDEQLLIDSTPQITSAVVPNGVDTDYFTPRPDPGGQTLLFCGSLDMFPSVDAMNYFFKAIWPALISRQPNIEIFLVGRNPPNWLMQLSAQDHRIHVPGFVDDVRPYFRKATALVSPIRDGGGTRLKILDSAAMGVPVIGTSFASSGLYLEHQKHLLSADTPNDFVRAVEQVLSDKALRERLSNAALEVVNRHYSWGVIGRSLIEAYDAAKRASNTAMHHSN